MSVWLVGSFFMFNDIRLDEQKKNRAPGRKEHTRLRPEDTAQRPNLMAGSLKSFGQVYLSLLSIAMINHSDQKQSGKEKAYLADTF